MPFKSQAQSRWAHSSKGERALGGPVAVKEWEQSTNYSKLPEKAGGLMEKKNWIQGAVKKPGALTEAAKRHGVSKAAEATKESHSSDPSIRGRGLLAKRFMSGDLKK